MSLSVKDIEFSIGAGVASSTLAVTGVGFQPKAVIFFSVGRTESADAGAAGRSRRCVGFAAATTQGGGIKNRAVAGSHEHGIAAGTASASSRWSPDKCLISSLTDGNDGGSARVLSFDTDGFTLTITVAWGTNHRIIALCYGGADISNIEIGSFTSPTTGTMPVYTDHATGFNCVDEEGALFLLSGKGSLEDESVFDDALSFGVATSKANQVAFAGGMNDDNATNTLAQRHMAGGLIFSSFNGVFSSLVRRAGLDSWNLTGFRLRWWAINSTQNLVYWMAIKGGKWKAVSGLTGTSLSTTVISGVGFTPAGGLLFSHSGVDNGNFSSGIEAGDKSSFGVFTSPTSRRAVAQHNSSEVATSAIGTRIEHDEVYCRIDSAGAVVGLMDVQSMDSDGVTFVMDDADPTASYFAALLTGNPAGGGGGGSAGGARVARTRRRR